MNARVARLLTRLYPRAWRVRYGEEFKAFLEERCVTPGDVLNVTWATRPLQLATVPVLVLAGSIVVMAAGVAGWGLLADRYAPSAFHARFGLLGSTMFVSWIGSLALFAAAAVTALRSARRVLASRAE